MTIEGNRNPAAQADISGAAFYRDFRIWHKQQNSDPRDCNSERVWPYE
jgi:hypothetical protein